MAASFEAEGLRCFEVDHQLVLGRRLHRKVGWFLALEDAVDVAGRAAVLFVQIRAIGDQAAEGDEVTFEVDRGHLVPGRKRDDQITIKTTDDGPPVTISPPFEERPKAANGALNLGGAGPPDRVDFHP